MSSIRNVAKQYGSKKKIANLLQVDSYFGSAKKSVKRPLIAVVMLSIPILLLFNIWRYLTNYVHGKTAIVIVLLGYALYAWQVVARVLLNQSERIKDYIRLQRQRYEPVGKYLTVKKIEDSIVTFADRGAFMIVCYSGSQATSIKNFHIQSFLDALYEMDNIQYEIYVQNSSEEDIEFSQVYQNIRSMPDQHTAKQILDMIRDTAAETVAETRILRTVYVIYASNDEIKFVKEQLSHNLPLEAYYKCEIADDDLIKRILEYDLGVDLNLEEITISSYASDFMGQSGIILKTKRKEQIEVNAERKQERRL